ncbi:hypothetical protein GDS87_24835 (plasmid) [Lysinibacillus pakistanensis]|uniref:Uncharacterized protein n=2 Tax=Lysinibacillus pakistanensis TaxID=759811 RepID=A0ABX6DH02_9BACI|nr:hypothetical protein GDS87_24555 [Lysinibacillus pakistanensis]QGG54149.1 hypothetical protein GDS87_24835 [Lysinibacillus pakistanensis]
MRSYNERELINEMLWLIETNYSVLNDTFYLSDYYQHWEFEIPEGYYLCFVPDTDPLDVRLAPKLNPEQLN